MLLEYFAVCIYYIPC